MTFKGGPTTNQWHVYWDGSAWQSELMSTFSASPAIFGLKSGIMMYREFGARYVASSIKSGGFSFLMGNPVTSSWDALFCDPIQHQINNVAHLLMPDGDTPQVFTLGDHHRCFAAS